MKCLNRPDYIGVAEWNALLKKYNYNLPDSIIQKLELNYPVQYLIGNVDFFNTNLFVNENVLIPRFETELLVEKTIAIIKQYFAVKPSVIDLGCGSGAISVSLSKALNIPIDAVDVSRKALNLAQKNAQNNNAKINTIHKDILKDEMIINHQIIISNPPYVSYDEIVDLQTKYEPKFAIYANNNGLEFYEKIVELAGKNKQSYFWLIFEIGYKQGESIKRIILKKFPNAKISCEKDFNAKDRYIFAEIFCNLYINKL